MEYKISCPKCRSGIVQHYELVGNGQVMVLVQCLNTHCQWGTTFVIPFSNLLQDEPALARKLIRYETMMVDNN